MTRTLSPLPRRMFCTDSPKAIKAQQFGFLNAILYLAPHEYAGVGNLCPHASPACIALCLGLHSGQASMVKSEKKKDANGVRKSRALKSQHFMLNRAQFMRHMVLDIARNYMRAIRARMRLAVRPNGATDIAYEGIGLDITPDDARAIAKITGGRIIVAAGRYANIFAVYPMIQFLDYTKNPNRFKRALPSNYDLTFSRSETNESAAWGILANGSANVAIVFDRLPQFYGATRVIDGDSHDLRFLDPRGVIVGLTPKGPRAKKDRSGFVVRNAA